MIAAVIARANVSKTLARRFLDETFWDVDEATRLARKNK